MRQKVEELAGVKTPTSTDNPITAKSNNCFLVLNLT